MSAVDSSFKFYADGVYKSLPVVPKAIAGHYGNEADFMDIKFYIVESNITEFLSYLDKDRFMIIKLNLDMQINQVTTSLTGLVSKLYPFNDCSMIVSLMLFPTKVKVMYGSDTNEITCVVYD